MGFLLQNGDKTALLPVATLSGIFPDAELRAMKPEEFAQIQQAIITQIRRGAANVGRRSIGNRISIRGNMRFDSRDKSSLR